MADIFIESTYQGFHDGNEGDPVAQQIWEMLVEAHAK
jgi:hypothetical protein